MKYSKIIAAVCAVLMLTSCTATAGGNNGSGDSASQNQNSATQSQTEKSEESKAELDYSNLCMQRVSIQTVSNDPKAIDFATVPVAGFVSEMIASYTPGYKIPAEPYYEACTVTLRDPDGSVIIDGAPADVKVRGNWTTTYDKKPLRIKFNEKQSMKGLNDDNAMRNWVLLAEYKDASMLRNKTALSISREILEKDGLYASDAELVEVDINGEYFGVYLLAEQQQINENRVNIFDAPKDYTGTDIGYLLEFDGAYYAEDDMQTFVPDYADNAPLESFNGDENGKKIQCQPKDDNDYKGETGIVIKSKINTKEQKAFIKNFVNNTYRIMYEASYNNKAFVFNDDFSKITEDASITPEEAVRRVVDVDSLADMYIISELTCDADIYFASFYMDADFSAEGDKKLRFEAPWDFDSAMGNKDRCADGTGFYAASIVPDVNSPAKVDPSVYEWGFETINPWLAVLMKQSWYLDIIREKWTAAYDDGVFDRGLKLVENDKVEYKTAFENNYKKWNNLGNGTDFAHELTKRAVSCKNEEEAADYLHEWLESRVKFLNDYWHK